MGHTTGGGPGGTREDGEGARVGGWGRQDGRVAGGVGVKAAAEGGPAAAHRGGERAEGAPGRQFGEVPGGATDRSRATDVVEVSP